MGKFTYDYAMPALTSDVAVLRLDDVPEILLIQRKDPPFEDCWALPGGFMEIEETLEEAARRELMEETGIEAGELIRFDVYDKPGRDPRGRTVTQVYVMIWKEEMGIPRASSDALSLAWFDLTSLPDLAFDHNQIISDVIRLIQEGTK
jgi:8-oxo-dGTP diphosphatase